MNEQETCGTRLPINFRQKTWRIYASRGDSPCFQKKLLQLWMFVRPSSGADICPELDFIRSNRANVDIAPWLSFGHDDLLIKNTADFNGAVVASAKQV